jgi:hypothetical protein
MRFVELDKSPNDNNRGPHGLKSNRPLSFDQLAAAEPASVAFEFQDTRNFDSFLRKHCMFSNAKSVQIVNNPNSPYLKKAEAFLEILGSFPTIVLREFLQRFSDVTYKIDNFANDEQDRPLIDFNETSEFFKLKIRQFNIGMLGIISQDRNGLLPITYRLEKFKVYLKKDKPDFVFLEELWEEADQELLVALLKEDYSIFITNIGSSHQLPHTPALLGSGLAVLVRKDTVNQYNIALDDIQFHAMERIGIDRWFSRKGFAYTAWTVNGKKMGFISSHFQAGLGVPKWVEEVVDQTGKTTTQVRNDDLLMLCDLYDKHIDTCDDGLLFLSADMNINFNDPKLYDKYPAMIEVEKRFHIIPTSSTALSKEILLEAKALNHMVPLDEQEMKTGEDIDVLAVSQKALLNGTRLCSLKPNLDTEEDSDHVPLDGVFSIPYASKPLSDDYLGDDYMLPPSF